MKLDVTYRNVCRICGAENLYLFLRLPDMPMSDGHVDPSNREDPFLADLNIYWCPRCGVVQTLHDVDLSDYYHNYDYTVSQSAFVQRFMKKFADETCTLFGIRKGDTVIEIGSGDGLQLRYFRELGARVLGFEPSQGLCRQAIKNEIDTVASCFSDDAVKFIPENMSKAKVVVCQYTFDHVPNPVAFLKDISKILDPVFGVIIIEVHDFEKIVQRNEACLFAHEHSVYLTRESILSVLRHAGYKPVSFNFIPEDMCRGNSLIVAAVLEKNRLPIALPQDNGFLLRLRQRDLYRDFSAMVKESHNRLLRHVRKLRTEGKRVAGYGAAGRGVHTMAIAGLTKKEIECVYDMNSALHGLEMPATGVLVSDPKNLFKDPVDEIIVFNYGYLGEIKKYLASYVNSGGRVTSVLEYLGNRDRD
ncbi:MAG: class I SAM-dependent methyltransferase [Candidatus Aceula meridiana]|nr:class I SAM-dependent methyltransferase [Candidatus Aceula meridiana]